MDGQFYEGTRGAAAVGTLDELGAIEAGAVVCLRLSCVGPASPERQSFEAELGPFGGKDALNAIGALCELCRDYGRRPLMRHGVSCRCLGGDEACVAQIVGSVMAGERDDAMLMATLLVRADMAMAVVQLAEQAGVALARLAATPTTPQERRAGTRLH